jgi:site-specific recombinase XerD
MKTKTENCQSASTSQLVKTELEVLISSIEKRMSIANRSPSSSKSYVRAVVRLYDFHTTHPKDLELDQILDFLLFIKNEKGLHWRTIKLYVAGLRYYYSEIVGAIELAQQIPYPKEKPSLPEVISREELQQLFEGCLNYKHKVMFRLMYSAGLRRSELAKLKLTDIETQDGKMRIRINTGKGGKDRYTVLSFTILEELRIYYTMCRPKTYLFNGRVKGEPMSLGGIRHALLMAIKKSKLKRHVNLHILRHCFASHALEDGLNIKTLQYLLGHQSVLTTMIYLHVSDVPLSKAFSPLDNWH